MNNILHRSDILDIKDLKLINNFILDNAVEEPERSPIGNFLDTNIGYWILIPKLKKIFKEIGWDTPVSVQCWANIFKEGEGTIRHNHYFEGLNGYSAHIFISGHTSIGTWYEEEDGYEKDVNVPGQIVIFPTDLNHYVPENIYDELRITLALDMYPGIHKQEYGNVKIQGAVGRREFLVIE